MVVRLWGFESPLSHSDPDGLPVGVFCFLGRGRAAEVCDRSHTWVTRSLPATAPSRPPT